MLVTTRFREVIRTNATVFLESRRIPEITLLHNHDFNNELTVDTSGDVAAVVATAVSNAVDHFTSNKPDRLHASCTTRGGMHHMSSSTPSFCCAFSTLQEQWRVFQCSQNKKKLVSNPNLKCGSSPLNYTYRSAR